MRIVLVLGPFLAVPCLCLMAACGDDQSDGTEAPADAAASSSSSSSSSSGRAAPPGDDAGAEPEDSGDGGSSGGPKLEGCEVAVEQSTLANVSEDERLHPTPVCRDVWIDRILADGGSIEGDPIDPACFDCFEAPAFDQAPYVTGCLSERGETGACLDEVGLFERCLTAACDFCQSSGGQPECLQHAGMNQCSDLAAHPSCSAQIGANLSFCTSDAGTKLMCGGKPAVGHCSGLVQQAQDVVPTQGTQVPSFVGGAVAEGTYVATKVEGYGDLWPGLESQVKSETIRVTGSQLDEVSVAASTHVISSQGGAFGVSGSSFIWDQSCPSAVRLPFHYTATETSLVLGFGLEGDSPGDGFVVTYAKL